MADIEYFSGLFESGIVPRAPHAGPLLQHVYEQEHGRGGFAGKVSQTYHLYPPNNWLPGETKTLESRCAAFTCFQSANENAFDALSTFRSALVSSRGSAARRPRRTAADCFRLQRMVSHVRSEKSCCCVCR